MFGKEATFIQMRDTLTFMLITAIDSKCMGDECEKERLESIKKISDQLFELWGIGYQIYPEDREILLGQISQMIDTLVED